MTKILYLSLSTSRFAAWSKAPLWIFLYPIPFIPVKFALERDRFTLVTVRDDPSFFFELRRGMHGWIPDNYDFVEISGMTAHVPPYPPTPTLPYRSSLRLSLPSLYRKLPCSLTFKY